MQPSSTQHPTNDELSQFSIRAFKGIEVGLGQADPLASMAQKLEEKYPAHLILIQAGKFLHGFDRTAYALNILKKYKLQMVGATSDPHIRVGFPAGNFKKRLWSMVEEFDIPYVVSLGNQATGYDIYVSSQRSGQASVLSSVSDQLIQEVITDLRQVGEVNKSAAQQLLANPDSSGFKLKSHAQDLDTQLLQDIIKMPRDLRVTYGENVRTCMSRLMPGIYAYGTATDKAGVLHSISTEVDLLKHYLTQAPKLSNLKFAFEHRVGLAVELGRLVGGLIRSAKVQP